MGLERQLLSLILFHISEYLDIGIFYYFLGWVGLFVFLKVHRIHSCSLYVCINLNFVFHQNRPLDTVKHPHFYFFFKKIIKKKNQSGKSYPSVQLRLNLKSKPIHRNEVTERNLYSTKSLDYNVNTKRYNMLSQQ